MFKVNASSCRACLPEKRRWAAFLRLSAVALMLSGLFLMAGASSKPVGAYSDAWVSADVLNLREDAGTWAGVIDQMWDGEYVGVLDGPTGDGWYLVEYQGAVGWAFGAYLSINGSAGWGGDASGGSSGGERWADVNRSTGLVTLYEGDTPDRFVCCFVWLGYVELRLLLHRNRNVLRLHQECRTRLDRLGTGLHQVLGGVRFVEIQRFPLLFPGCQRQCPAQWRWSDRWMRGAAALVRRDCLRLAIDRLAGRSALVERLPEGDAMDPVGQVIDQPGFPWLRT